MLTAFPGARQTKGRVLPRAVNKGNTAQAITTLPPAPKNKNSAQRREQSLDYADDLQVEAPPKSNQARRRERSPEHRNDPDARTQNKRSRQSSNVQMVDPRQHAPATVHRPDPAVEKNIAVDADEDNTQPLSDWIKIMSKLRPNSSVEQRRNDGYAVWYDDSRETVRNVGHFTRFERVLRNGLKHWSTALKDQPWTKAQRYDHHVEDMLVFEILLQRFDGLAEHILELYEHPDVVKRIAAFLDSMLSKTRSDDLARLNKSLFKFIEGVTNPLIYTDVRGFNDPILGRELSPPDWLDEFDEDPTSFCAKVQNGKKYYKSGCLPSFLFDLEKYNPDEPLSGFLEGTTLEKAIILIYNGPSALLPDRRTAGKSQKGQRSIAKKHGVTQLTVEAVIYVAGLVRHVLCTSAEWNEKDGQYNIAQMTEKIKNLCLRNPRRMSGIMSSYSTKLFGKTHTSHAIDEDIEHNTTYARMMAWEGNEIADAPGAFYDFAIQHPLSSESMATDDESDDNNHVAGPSGTTHSEGDEPDHEAPADDGENDALHD